MDTDTQNSFSRVDGVVRVFDMEKVKDEIWVNDTDKVFRITDNGIEPLIEEFYDTVSFIPAKDSVFFTRGREIYKSGTDSAGEAEKIIDAGSRVIDLVYHDNFLWVITLYEVSKFDAAGKEVVNYSLNRDNGIARFLNVIRGQVVAGTDWGMLVYDLEKKSVYSP